MAFALGGGAAATGGAAAAANGTALPLLISWDDLQPQRAPPPAAGEYGVVFPGLLRRRKGDVDVFVAVKLFKLGASGSAAQIRELLGLLEREAATLRLATSDQFWRNEHIVHCYGMVRGPAPHWSTALLHHAQALEFRDAATASAAGGPLQQPPPPPPQLAGIVMSFEDGGSLRDRLYPESGAAWAASTLERLTLLVQIARGLAYLHNGDPCIVYGDLKPENVMMTKDGRPRLADFGFAEVRGRSSSLSMRSEAELIAGEKARGTWPYMAPELYRTQQAYSAEAISRSSDVYAFATLAWEVLSGRQPWLGWTETTRLFELLNPAGARLEADALPGDLPPTVRETLLAQCLAFDRNARPQMSRVLSVLQNAADRLADGSFDVFISYCWGGQGAPRKPLAEAVYGALQNEGIKCWFDQFDMGHSVPGSMEKGVRASAVFVVLVTPDYAKSANCMKELREAIAAGKPIVACIAEPGSGAWDTWMSSDAMFGGVGFVRAVPDGSELAVAAALRDNLWVDLRHAASLDWAANPILPAQRKVLTHAPEAAPLLIKLLKEKGVKPSFRGPVAAAVEAAAAAEAARLAHEAAERERERREAAARAERARQEAEARAERARQEAQVRAERERVEAAARAERERRAAVARRAQTTAAEADAARERVTAVQIELSRLEAVATEARAAEDAEVLSERPRTEPSEKSRLPQSNEAGRLERNRSAEAAFQGILSVSSSCELLPRMGQDIWDGATQYRCIICPFCPVVKKDNLWWVTGPICSEPYNLCSRPSLFGLLFFFWSFFLPTIALVLFVLSVTGIVQKCPTDDSNACIMSAVGTGITGFGLLLFAGLVFYEEFRRTFVFYLVCGQYEGALPLECLWMAFTIITAPCFLLPIFIISYALLPFFMVLAYLILPVTAMLLFCCCHPERHLPPYGIDAPAPPEVLRPISSPNLALETGSAKGPPNLIKVGVGATVDEQMACLAVYRRVS